MSRVERTEDRNDRRDSRQAERGRSSSSTDMSPKTTPTKAEGELNDIEQALENQKE